MKYLFLLCSVFLLVLFGNDYYGTIEIGGKGVKAYVIEHDSAQTRIVARNSINTAPQSGMNADKILSETMIAAIIRDIQTLRQKTFQSYGTLASNHEFIVASSAINKIANKERLSQRIFQTTALPLYFIDEKEESLFGFYGAVPKDEWNTAAMIDIGGGNTKIAWLDEEKRFRFQEIPLGTVSLTKRANADQSAAAFRQKAFNAVQAYAHTIDALPIKPSVYLVGGIFWATAYYQHDGQLKTFTPLNGDDFDILASTFSASAIGQNCTPDTVEKTCFLLRYYGAKNLVAGAVLAQTLLEHYRNSQKIVFAKEGAWMIGWLLQNLQP
jgi:hypothetical protein